MPLRALSDLLWRERDLLEVLLYKLEVEQLLLAAGRTARLPIASREVEDVLEQVRTAELGRATEVEEVAGALGLPSDATLLQIAEASPAPWNGILTEHRTAFIALTNEIATVAESNRDILTAAHHATQETLMALRESVETYDERGATSRGPADAHMLDESL